MVKNADNLFIRNTVGDLGNMIMHPLKTAENLVTHPIQTVSRIGNDAAFGVAMSAKSVFEDIKGGNRYGAEKKKIKKMNIPKNKLMTK